MLFPTPNVLPDGLRPGSLVMVGCGMKGISQFTLEGVAYIERADIVFYNVTTPDVERFIQQKNPNSYDLTTLYGPDIPRRRTYSDMVRVMVSEVRKGRNVVGVFTGHPGVAADAPHKAVNVARYAGFQAALLPGVSAEACLFADLGVDPFVPGCQTVEATELLITERPLAIDSHIIIFQVGLIGIDSLPFDYEQQVSNPRLRFLQERLSRDYGEDHTVIHYIASPIPGCDDVVERYTVGDIAKPHVTKRITILSTFYIPPKGRKKHSQSILEKIRSVPDERESKDSKPDSSDSIKPPINNLAQFVNRALPTGYRRTAMTTDMANVLHSLATIPNEVNKFNDEPRHYLSSSKGLSAQEFDALSARDPRRIIQATKKPASATAANFVFACLDAPSLATRYALGTIADNIDQITAHQTIERWFEREGYDTSPLDVCNALDQAKNKDLKFYANSYQTVLNGTIGPTITIGHNTVRIDDTEIRRFSFSKGVLRWDTGTENSSSAELSFAISPDATESCVANDAYVGPHLHGGYWTKDEPAPKEENILGKIGLSTVRGITGDLLSDPIDTWVGSYHLHHISAENEPMGDITLKQDDETASVAIYYDNNPVRNVRYANNTIHWSASKNNSFNGVIFFCQNGKSFDSSSQKKIGLLGKIWSSKMPTPVHANVSNVPNCINSNGVNKCWGLGLLANKIAGINLGLAQAAISLGKSVIEVNNALKTWTEEPSSEAGERYQQQKLRFDEQLSFVRTIARWSGIPKR